MYWNSECKIKKITIEVPEKEFRKFPSIVKLYKVGNFETRDTDGEFGKFEKSKRFLRRLIRSATDNNANYEVYNKLLSEYNVEEKMLMDLTREKIRIAVINVYDITLSDFRILKNKVKELVVKISNQQKVVDSVKWKKEKYIKWHGEMM